MHRYNKGTRIIIPANAKEELLVQIANDIAEAWKALQKEAIHEMDIEGIKPEEVKYRYGVSVRYTGQIESFDTLLETGEMQTSENVRNLITSFEDMYSKMYPEGAKFSGAGFTITEVNLEAIADKPQPNLLKHQLESSKPNKNAFVEKRQVYHKDGWKSFSVYEMANLMAGNVISGPAIIRDPMTTVIIPPDFEMFLDEFLVLHYRRAS